MFRRYFSVVLLFAFCSLASAQSNVDEKKREINSIKKSPDQYLYVEVVDSLEEVAVTKAQHYLQDEIDEFVEQQAKLKNAPKIVAVDMKKVVTMPRGNNRVRAFAYIKKSNIIAADNAVVLKRDACRDKARHQGCNSENKTPRDHRQTFGREAFCRFGRLLEQTEKRGIH